MAEGNAWALAGGARETKAGSKASAVVTEETVGKLAADVAWTLAEGAAWAFGGAACVWGTVEAMTPLVVKTEESDGGWLEKGGFLTQI